jgi:hypothetical protein
MSSLNGSFCYFQDTAGVMQRFKFLNRGSQRAKPIKSIKHAFKSTLDAFEVDHISIENA